MSQEAAGQGTGAMTEAVLKETQNWAGFSHRELYEAVHLDNDPGRVGALAEEWSQLSREIGESSQHMSERLRGTESGWQGEAADAARSAIQQLASWNSEAGATASTVSSHFAQQGRIVEVAKAEMPEPLEAPPVEQTYTTNDLASMARAADDMKVQQDKANSAHQLAVQVMTNMEAQSRQLDSTTPRFVPPPDPINGTSPAERGVRLSPNAADASPAASTPAGAPAPAAAAPGAPVPGVPGGAPAPGTPAGPGVQPLAAQMGGGPGAGLPQGPQGQQGPGAGQQSAGGAPKSPGFQPSSGGGGTQPGKVQPSSFTGPQTTTPSSFGSPAGLPSTSGGGGDFSHSPRPLGQDGNFIGVRRPGKPGGGQNGPGDPRSGWSGQVPPVPSTGGGGGAGLGGAGGAGGGAGGAGGAAGGSGGSGTQVPRGGSAGAGPVPGVGAGAGTSARGPAGMPGQSSPAGMGGMGAPGAQRGQGEEDKTRSSKYVQGGPIVEVPGADLPPPVIGEGKRKKKQDREQQQDQG